MIDRLSAGAAALRRFQRCVRLNDAAQFRQVSAHGLRFTNQAFTVLAHANQRGHARLGLAISKKCARRATTRNRIKRLVRESFRAAQHGLPAVDMVVICRPPGGGMTNQELAAALEGCWRRLRERCKDC